MKKYLRCLLRYHFFEAYHGSHACDGAAWGAKKQLSLYQRRHTFRVTRPDHITIIIETMLYHSATVAARIQFGLPALPTLVGIRKNRYLMWVFTEDFTVQNFPSSASHVPACTYDLVELGLDENLA